MANILIVEDEQLIGLAMKSAINSIGHHVIAIEANGKQALQMAREQKPDLILMDIILQGAMNGIETAKTISAELDIPIIYVTGNKDRAILKEAELTDPYGFHIKPVEYRELQISIDLALKKHSLQHQLKASEGKYRSFIQQSRDGIMLIGNDGRIIEWNSSIETLTGFTGHEIQYRFIWELLFELSTADEEGPVTENSVMQTFSKVLNNGKRNAADGLLNLTIRNRKNELKFIQGSIFSITHFNKQAVGVIIRDLTSQRALESSLQEQQQLYKDLFESMVQGVIHQTRDGIILSMNPSTERILGIRRDDYIGKLWNKQRILAYREDGSPLEEDQFGVVKAFQTGEAVTGQVMGVYIQTLSDVRWLRVSVFPQFSSEDHLPVSAISILEDITESKIFTETQQITRDLLEITNSNSDLDRMLKELSERIKRYSRFDITAFRIQDENPGGRSGRLIGLSGNNGAFREEILLEQIDTICTAGNSCLDRMETFRTNDFEGAAGKRDCLFRSIVIIPLRTENSRTGILILADREKNKIRSSIVSALETAAIQISTAITRINSEQKVKRQVEGLKKLNSIIYNIGLTFNFGDIQHSILQHTLDAIGGNGAVLYLYDEEKQKYIMETSLNISRDLKQRINEFREGEGLSGAAVQTRMPIIVPDLSISRGKNIGPAIREGWRSIAALPLLRQDLPMGVLLIAGKKAYLFESYDIEVLKAVGNHIAIALDNAHLYKETKAMNVQLEERVEERTKNLQELYAVSQNLSYIMQYEDLFSLMMTHMKEVIPCDVAAGILVDHSIKDLYIWKWKEITPDLEKKIRQDLIFTFTKMGGNLDSGDALREKHYNEISDTGDSRTINTVNSVFQAPILVDREVKGILFLGSSERNNLSDEHIQFLYTIINQVSESIGRLQAILKIEEQRLSSLIENLPEGVLLLNRKHQIIVENPPALKILERICSIDESERILTIGGTPTEDFFRKNPEHQPMTIHDDTEGELTVEIQYQRIHEEKGFENGGAVLILKDVTQETIIQNKIQQQERLAAVGQLAAGIAHDFNNILTGIIGFSDYLILREDVPGSAKTYLRRIIQQGRRASQLIQQILDFSRKSGTDHYPLDLIPFLKEINKLFERIIPERIRLAFEYDESSAVINANPTQIQQILTNLVVNAKDAMPTGGDLKISIGHLHIQEKETYLVQGIPPGEWILLKVEDTGGGIPQETLPHIYEPFFTTKPFGQGTGLGLAQVYGLVEQHNAYIEVRSSFGQGTSFAIYFPAFTPDSPKQSPASEADGTPVINGSILLVEDEAEIRTMIKVMLEGFGYSVIDAVNGIDAIEKYTSSREYIPVVISDLVMPLMGGLSLYRNLKEIDPSVKMIIVSGYPLGPEKQNPAAEGIAGWIKKPYEIDTLIQTLQSVLNKGPEEKDE